MNVSMMSTATTMANATDGTTTDTRSNAQKTKDFDVTYRGTKEASSSSRR